MKDRYQKVLVTNNLNTETSSAWELIRHGMPQGSVLGPLLFLIYINDLASIIRRYASPILFADDTSVIISNSDSDEFKNIFNCVINDIATWCKKNCLALNLEKTQYIQFLTNNQKKLSMQVKVADILIPTLPN